MGSIANQREKAGGRQKYTVIATVVHLGDRGRLISESKASQGYTQKSSLKTTSITKKFLLELRYYLDQ